MVISPVLFVVLVMTTALSLACVVALFVYGRFRLFKTKRSPRAPVPQYFKRYRHS